MDTHWFMFSSYTYCVEALSYFVAAKMDLRTESTCIYRQTDDNAIKDDSETQSCIAVMT